MKRKTKIDYDIQKALSMVRGYRATLEWYIAERQNILSSSVTTSDSGGGSEASDKTFAATVKLEMLKGTREYREIQAIENAMRLIGSDFPRKTEREKLRQSIMLSCEDGRTYPYEHMNCDFVSRSDFYRRRKRFLLDVLVNL